MRFKDIDDQLTPIPLYIHTYFKVFTIFPYIQFINRIGDVMVSMLTLSVVDRDFEPRSCQTKDYKIGICCFSAKLSHRSLRATIGWLGIMIICQSGVTYLHADCRVSELAQYILNQACKAVLV